MALPWTASSLPLWDENTPAIIERWCDKALNIVPHHALLSHDTLGGVGAAGFFNRRLDQAHPAPSRSGLVAIWSGRPSFGVLQKRGAA
jgi:hypothetical protein